MTYYQYINIFVDYCGENGQYTNKNDAHMICMSVSQIKLNLPFSYVTQLNGFLIRQQAQIVK